MTATKLSKYAFENPILVFSFAGDWGRTTKDHFSSNDMHKLHAVASAEQSAAFVPFQRQQPGFPPHKNADSALCSLTTAVQFSGNDAVNAQIAAKTAICAA